MRTIERELGEPDDTRTSLLELRPLLNTFGRGYRYYFVPGPDVHPRYRYGIDRPSYPLPGVHRTKDEALGSIQGARSSASILPGVTKVEVDRIELVESDTPVRTSSQVQGEGVDYLIQEYRSTFRDRHRNELLPAFLLEEGLRGCLTRTFLWVASPGLVAILLTMASESTLQFEVPAWLPVLGDALEGRVLGPRVVMPLALVLFLISFLAKTGRRQAHRQAAEREMRILIDLVTNHGMKRANIVALYGDVSRLATDWRPGGHHVGDRSSESLTIQLEREFHDRIESLIALTNEPKLETLRASQHRVLPTEFVLVAGRSDWLPGWRKLKQKACRARDPEALGDRSLPAISIKVVGRFLLRVIALTVTISAIRSFASTEYIEGITLSVVGAFMWGRSTAIKMDLRNAHGVPRDRYPIELTNSIILL